MKKTIKSKSALFLYAAAILVFAVGTVSLVVVVSSYVKTVAQYVAQGYPEALVKGELFGATLLPGIFQSIGLYWGIAFVLFGLAAISKKLSAFMPAAVSAEPGKAFEAEPVDESAEPEPVIAGEAEEKVKSEDDE